MDQNELRELEARCIQEYAPACTAACPIHVDVRGMLAAVSQGDFTAGLKILRKTLPFPGIISRVCDQPCRAACKRSEIGDSLAIAALEKACVQCGTFTDKITVLPRKSKRVAVVGGGLSGLTAAFDLRRKGYETVLFEAGSQLGGDLWDYPQERLPWTVILDELGLVVELGVDVRLDTPVGKVGKNGRQPPLSLLCEDFDAVYLGIGLASSETYDLGLNEQGQVRVDPLTFMTSQDGIFAGGGYLHARAHPAASPPQFSSRIETSDRQPAEFPEPIDQQLGSEAWLRSPIRSIADGRRAAISIDRYLQKVSLTAARSNEGSYTTRLYTSTEGIQALAAVPVEDPAVGYAPEEAVQEAQRCIQCQCLECVKVCEYLRSYNGYPKRYVREVYNNLSIVMGTRHANTMINSCSLCGLCGEACPEDVDMGAVCKAARQLMVQQKRMPPSAHDFALRDMAFSNSQAFALWRHQPGTTASALAFFPGCQLSGSSPEYVERLYQELIARPPEAAAGGVGLILRCCGAPAEWSGRSDLFQEAREEFLGEYEKMGRPRLILACSSCYQMFKTQYPEVAIQSLWPWLEARGGFDQRRMDVKWIDSNRLAVHDPCTTRYEAEIQDSVRRMVANLGYEIEELPLNRERTECCSFGGVMWLANPALSRQVVQRRIDASPTPYLTYCAMCRDFFARQGKPTLHLLDLVFGADLDELARRKDPGFSQRHTNRRRLKNRLLQELWGDNTMTEESESYRSIHLIIPPEVQALLEERLILVEDIQQVIESAERTGSKFLHTTSGHWLAQHKLAQVTYWVEYSPSGEAYHIHNAYSHRMEIGGGAEK
jgi:NADPH-dependent glutamate synthase beta subunit-like oxidoreductase